MFNGGESGGITPGMPPVDPDVEPERTPEQERAAEAAKQVGENMESFLSLYLAEERYFSIAGVINDLSSLDPESIRSEITAFSELPLPLRLAIVAEVQSALAQMLQN